MDDQVGLFLLGLCNPSLAFFLPAGQEVSTVHSSEEQGQTPGCSEAVFSKLGSLHWDLPAMRLPSFSAANQPEKKQNFENFHVRSLDYECHLWIPVWQASHVVLFT